MNSGAEMVWTTYRIYYQYPNGKIDTCVVDTWMNDPEYAWRMSGWNVPHAKFVRAEIYE